jgi:hypothetical protein
MNSNDVTVQILIDEDSITDKSFDLLFNINNDDIDIVVKNTFILPISPRCSSILIENFILMIKQGKSKERLTVMWNKLGIDNNKITEIQFLFVLKETKANILSNVIAIN